MARAVLLLESRKAAAAAALLAAVGVCANLACVGAKDRMQPLKEQPAPRIEKLLPDMTVAGKGFQIQPSGESAIVVVGSDFVSASRVCFDGKPAVTTYGSGTALTALVPAEVYGREGTVQVTVRNGDGRVSNSFPFRVSPATGSPPRISGLRPAACVVGQGFNVQPNGESAIAVDGENFLPGATIYFDRSPLVSAFGNTGTLTATVPESLLRKPRVAKVHVKNPDGKVSNSMSFSVLRRTP